MTMKHKAIATYLSADTRHHWKPVLSNDMEDKRNFSKEHCTTSSFSMITHAYSEKPHASKYSEKYLR